MAVNSSRHAALLVRVVPWFLHQSAARIPQQHGYHSMWRHSAVWQGAAAVQRVTKVTYNHVRNIAHLGGQNIADTPPPSPRCFLLRPLLPLLVMRLRVAMCATLPTQAFPA
jgi:hypothetical protein